MPAFIAVWMQNECCPWVLIEEESQLQNSGKGPCWCLSEKRGVQCGQRGPYQIPRQECSSQRIRDQVEMDAQIVCTLQVEEQAKEQGRMNT